MEHTPTKNLLHSRFVMYILGFIFTLHFTLPVYINSTYLSKFVSEQFVGIVYTISSIFTILLFMCIPYILKRVGNYRTVMSLLVFELASLLVFAVSQNITALIISFIVGFAAVAVINFNMDIFLENLSTSEAVGKIRGFFLTSANVAWIIAPLLTSFILTGGDYWKIYLTSAIIILPVFLLLASNLKTFVDPEYHPVPFWKTIKQIWSDKNILATFAVAFLLQLFYALMVIYMPIYLHDHIHFNWTQIGVMFGIMLLPFVLTELPLGKLADTKYGEKEIMTIGFIILAISTGIMSFVQHDSFLLWTTLLFITRIGASMVEIMTETYFFKKIDGSSVNLMSFFRTMRPWAYVVGPIIATGLFTFIEFKYLFAILGLMMFYGVRYSLSLEDTR